MDYSIINVLPHLNSLEEKKVCKWVDDFDNLMKLSGISDKEKQYRLAFLVSEEEAREKIVELKQGMGEEYPSLNQIKDKLLGIKSLSKIEIYDKLKTMVIKKEENIKDFNKTYLELYNKIDQELKVGIKVEDYLHAIDSRTEACYTVIFDEADTIDKACKAAEKAENLKNYRQSRQEKQKSSGFTFGSNFRKDIPFIPGTFTKYHNEMTHTPKFLSLKSTGDSKQNVSTPVFAHKLTCYRCGEEGHKGYKCPYSDEELVKILTKRLEDKKLESKSAENSPTQKN